MARRIRLRVVGRFDQAYQQVASVTIDRDTGLMAVRPLRRRREYVAPLATVASILVARVTQAEVRERLRTKGRPGRRGRRGL